MEDESKLKTSEINDILVTGGAGFIGSHTVDLLIEKGYNVKILDKLEYQVHRGEKPEYLNDKATLIEGDMRDRKLIHQLIKDTDAVIHLASAVGVGQSMYQIEKYVDYNTRGTATLLDVLVNENNNVKKFVIASSMSIYGEGKYHCQSCSEDRTPRLRDEKQLKDRIWNLSCPKCGETLKHLPTDEAKPIVPTSIYAMSKRHQEEMALLIGETYGIPTVALRYFNAYGPRQSLSNPYTGACAIFCSRILNGKNPYIFEDGEQVRDFIHVSDVAKANVLALEKNGANYHAINIGTGEATSIRTIAKLLIELMRLKLKPEISGKYRKGDIRDCYADISLAQKTLGFRPSIKLKDGLKELTEWAETHGWGAVDLFEKTLKELEKRKLAT